MRWNGKFGKGRLRAGERNATEARYEHDVLEPALKDGSVLWYKFESITLKLAEGCRYTPDYAVMRADGTIELHEVKGSKAIFQDDAKVKVKTCAELFPFRLLVCYPRPKKDGGGWLVEEI